MNVRGRGWEIGRLLIKKKKLCFSSGDNKNKEGKKIYGWRWGKGRRYTVGGGGREV